jgi:hypothetical protein
MSTVDIGWSRCAGVAVMIQTKRPEEALVSTVRYGPPPNSSPTTEHHRSTTVPPCGKSRHMMGNNQGRNRRLRWSRP